MKKWIIGFLAIFVLIGGLIFFVFEEHKMSEEDKKFQDSLHWVVNDESKGNYQAKNVVLNMNFDEAHDDEISEEITTNKKVSPTTPDMLLMDFFAQAQKGTPLILSSFIDPSVLDTYNNELGQIEFEMNEFAKAITRNKTIQEIYIVKPKLPDNPTLINLDIKVVYQNGDKVITQIPMKKNTDGWSVNISTQDLINIFKVK